MVEHLENYKGRDSDCKSLYIAELLTELVTSAKPDCSQMEFVRNECQEFLGNIVGDPPFYLHHNLPLPTDRHRSRPHIRNHKIKGFLKGFFETCLEEQEEVKDTV